MSNFQSQIGQKRSFCQLKSSNILDIGDQILNNQYIITGLLGKGTFGQVYSIKDMNSGNQYALKVEIKTKNTFSKQFQNETIIFHMLKNVDSVPKIQGDVEMEIDG